MIDEPATAGLRPRVSVGMPVYNGTKTLAAAIESLTAQTCRDIEIIISDNGSSDDTAAICASFAARDARIRYTRQETTLSPTKNFNFVLAQARGEFFLWAAHDDTRDPDFIEKLTDGLEKNPDSILAFGDIVQMIDGKQSSLRLDFENKGKSAMQRLHWTAISPLHHLYGVWRTEALRKITWRHVDWWHDTPLMMAATLLGDFVYVPGTSFYYLYNKHPFFYWQTGAGHLSVTESAKKYLKRVWDLLLLVWVSIITVADVSGWGRGLLAGLFSYVKIMHQAMMFVRQRL